MKAALTLALSALALAACVPATPRPAPATTPTARPAPAAPAPVAVPQAPLASDWMDARDTPGAWRYNDYGPGAGKRSLFSDPDEASGILNFAVNGMVRILRDGWEQSPAQKARVTAVMEYGGHVEQWAEACIQRTAAGLEDPSRPGITTNEAYGSYLQWCETNKIDPWPDQMARELIKVTVGEVFRRPESNSLERPSGPQRGWRGLTLRTPLAAVKGEAA